MQHLKDTATVNLMTEAAKQLQVGWPRTAGDAAAGAQAHAARFQTLLGAAACDLKLMKFPLQEFLHLISSNHG